MKINIFNLNLNYFKFFFKSMHPSVRAAKNKNGAAPADRAVCAFGFYATPTVIRMFAKVRFSPVEIARRTSGSQQRS